MPVNCSGMVSLWWLQAKRRTREAAAAVEAEDMADYDQGHGVMA